MIETIFIAVVSASAGFILAALFRVAKQDEIKARAAMADEYKMRLNRIAGMETRKMAYTARKMIRIARGERI